MIPCRPESVPIGAVAKTTPGHEFTIMHLGNLTGKGGPENETAFWVWVGPTEGPNECKASVSVQCQKTRLPEIRNFERHYYFDEAEFEEFLETTGKNAEQLMETGLLPSPLKEFLLRGFARLHHVSGVRTTFVFGDSSYVVPS